MCLSRFINRLRFGLDIDPTKAVAVCYRQVLKQQRMLDNGCLIHGNHASVIAEKIAKLPGQQEFLRLLGNGCLHTALAVEYWRLVQDHREHCLHPMGQLLENAEQLGRTSAPKREKLAAYRSLVSQANDLAAASSMIHFPSVQEVSATLLKDHVLAKTLRRRFLRLARAKRDKMPVPPQAAWVPIS